MSRTWLVVAVACLLGAQWSWADNVLYRYEGDVLPYDPSAGWEIFSPCEGVCSESLSNGYFTLNWVGSASIVEYAWRIAVPPEIPPPTLWVEWRFRSSTPFRSIFYTCDGRFSVQFADIFDLVLMFGDTVFSNEGGDVVEGLDIEQFHSYRFESANGVNFRFSVDGIVIFGGTDNEGNGYSTIIMGGLGGCHAEDLPSTNEWDFVRFGELGDGEGIATTAPRGPFVDPEAVADFDRFTVTFDQPAYVYLDDITVSGSEAIPPQVIATHRLDNSEPEVLEFLLDRPLIPDETVTFTFDDGATVNEVTYTYSVDPYVPTVSEWGLTVTALLLLVAGSVLLRTRAARDT